MLLQSSLLHWVRSTAAQFDRELRGKLVSVYKPMRWIPCFLHRPIENVLKRLRAFPVVIEFTEGEEAYAEGLKEVRGCIASHMRCKFNHEHPSIGSCSARLSVQAIQHMMTHCKHVKRVHYDREVKALLNVATPAVRADALQRSGLTGSGVTIAVLDTGIYPHPDLTRRRNRIVAFRDFINNRTTPYDDNGHGTHCAGDAAGDGYASNGVYRGPAIDANLVGVKVLNRTGSGSLSTIIAGVEWCIANQARYGIRVLSMSLGAPAVQSYTTDPLVRVTEAAWSRGMVVCVAAGNEGPDAGTISSPGNSPRVITVGAVGDANTVSRADDRIAAFSSRGPTIDGVIKPDLVCPGVNIISLRSPNSYLDTSYKSNRVAGSYFTESGTSMATPICAGVVAQLLQSNPTLTPDEVKQRLLSSTEDLGLPPNVQGNGYLNAATLLGQE